MGPGKLDLLTKELIYLAMTFADQSVIGQLAQLHGAQEGHDGGDLGEFVSVVTLAQKGNKIATAYRVPVDAAFEEN